jgi:hypothetical protein
MDRLFLLVWAPAALGAHLQRDRVALQGDPAFLTVFQQAGVAAALKTLKVAQAVALLG